METQKELKCKDKVREACKERFNDIMALYEAFCEGNDSGVEGLGNIFEYGLCFDYVAPETFPGQKVGYFRYMLSYGGPSEEFRIFTDTNLNPYKVEFWYLDWYDGAKHELTGKRLEKFKDFFNNFYVEVETAAHVMKQALES